MNRLLLSLFTVIWGWQTLSAQAPDVTKYNRWAKAKHIRVGVKKAVDYVQLSATGTLLVLDDDKVVGSIKPGAAFFVSSSRVQAGGSVYFVRVRSHKSEQDIERHRDYLKRKFPSLGSKITQAPNKFYQLTLGPIKTEAEVDRIKAVLAKDIYTDTIVSAESSDQSFFWVNQQFDKEPFGASKPGLVCVDPNDKITFNDTPYRGALYFRIQDDGKIKVINKLPLETYLRGVVPSELSPWTYPHLEAHKAQAIAARTYALGNMNRFRKKGYDICDTPACQAYEGAKNETPLSDQAVAETEGIVIYHNNQLINAMYTSTEGTGTDDVERVFPKMDSPYLRGKTSYLAKFKAWDFPARKVDRARFENVPEDLAVRTILWGFPEIPDFAGTLTGADLNKAFEHIGWALQLKPISKQANLSYSEFWEALANQSMFKDVVTNQIKEQDLAILLRNDKVAGPLRGFAGLLVRYDLTDHDQLETFASKEPVSRAFAYQILINLCDKLGPKPDWTRYRMNGLEGNTLTATKSSSPVTIDLTPYKYYLAEIGDRWEFVEKPHMEEWDRVYQLEAPFKASVLRVKESGVVGSLDRFSAHDAWVERKTIAELEKSIKKQVPALKGLRDIRVLERSPDTGRVTKLALDAASGTHLVEGLKIRWSLGVNENLFDLLPGYSHNKLTHLTIMGRGMGHGVGMSQVGAFALARMGWDFKKILNHYYTGVEVRSYDGNRTQPND